MHKTAYTDQTKLEYNVDSHPDRHIHSHEKHNSYHSHDNHNTNENHKHDYDDHNSNYAIIIVISSLRLCNLKVVASCLVESIQSNGIDLDLFYQRHLDIILGIRISMPTCNHCGNCFVDVTHWCCGDFVHIQCIRCTLQPHSICSNDNGKQSVRYKCIVLLCIMGFYSIIVENYTLVLVLIMVDGFTLKTHRCV